MKRFAMVAALVALAAPALAQQVQVDAGLPAYQKASGVSGNINSRLRHDEQPDDALGRGVP